jgi:hypothetical protein
MSCLLAIAALCLPWREAEIHTATSSIAEVATFRSAGAEVVIWLESDNRPWGDWAHAPQVCISGKCIAYRRIDRSDAGSAKTTLMFCRSAKTLPERIQVSAASPLLRDKLLADMAIKSPFDALSEPVPLTNFNDTAAVNDSREQRMRGAAACP